MVIPCKYWHPCQQSTRLLHPLRGFAIAILYLIIDSKPRGRSPWRSRASIGICTDQGGDCRAPVGARKFESVISPYGQYLPRLLSLARKFEYFFILY